MATRQAVLALQGAASDALSRLRTPGGANSDAALGLRRLAAETMGFTGSAGERGWYSELLYYFNRPEQRSSEEPVSAMTPDEIREDLESGSPLAPSWSARAIDAGYIHDLAADYLDESEEETPRLLAPAIAAAPAVSRGFNEFSRVGLDTAERISSELRNRDLGTPADLRIDWRMVPDATLISSAVAPQGITCRLRKVKGEFVAVVTTDADWDDVDFDRLKRVINPDNWDTYYTSFFCDMVPLLDKDRGWTRVREEVSGQCDRYRLRTALRFWSGLRGNGMYLNYDLDGDREGTDTLVLVDNGYLWVEPTATGVHVRTSKELLISGMSATAMTVMAATMGWATNASDMFHNAVNYPYPDALADFVESQVDPTEPPIADTSTEWPLVIPRVPADIRDEMCSDTTDVLKHAFDRAGGLAADFATRWEDGIDVDDFHELSQHADDVLRDISSEAFDKATGNFRPAPNPGG